MRARACGTAAVVAGVLAVGVACAEDAVPETAPTTTVPTTARNRSRVTTTTISMEPVISVRVQPDSEPGFEDGDSDVRGLLCTFADGIWNASGTVVNTTATHVDYRVYLTFVDAAGNFRGLLQVDVDDVEPDERVEWSEHLTLLDPGVTCLLRVERTAR